MVCNQNPTAGDVMIIFKYLKSCSPLVCEIALRTRLYLPFVYLRIDILLCRANYLAATTGFW